MSRSRFDGGLVALAIVFGLLGGLIEGLIHMGLQRLGIADNSWYSIIWIAAIFNALLVGVPAVVVAAIVPRFGRPDRPRGLAVFLLLGMASLPWVALGSKNVLEPYVIASPYVVAIAALAIGVAAAGVCLARHRALTRWSRRALGPALVGTVLLVAGLEGGAWARERYLTARLPPVSSSAPNVLLVILESLRADHLSAHGYSRSTSPSIDRLAAEGVLFENALSTSSYTLPSHVSILSGLYPSEHNVNWNTWHRATTFPVLPEVLREKGYRTGIFSANSFYFTRQHGFGRGVLHFEDFFHSIPDMLWRTAYGGMVTGIQKRTTYVDLPGRKRAPDNNRAILRWAAQKSDRPFFITVNYMDTHDPYLPPQPYRSRFASDPTGGGRLNFLLKIPHRVPREQIQGEVDAYDGAIAFVDDHVGRLVADLRSAAPARDLIVVVTSDHGDEFGEHGGFLHARHLYREAIHVPLVIWSPGRVPAGRRIAQPVTNAAIPATVLALLDDDASTFPGPPLTALWESDQEPAEWPLPLAELEQRAFAAPEDPVRTGAIRSLVDATWHYIETGSRRELYNWLTDPVESTNLADRPESRPVLDAFAERLAAPGRPSTTRRPAQTP